MAYDTLDTTGMQIEDITWGGNVLRTSYGGGYGDSALVDNAAGLHLWALRKAGLPGSGMMGMNGAASRFDYYWQFFKDHTTGTSEIFIVAWRGGSYHASFVDTKMSASQMLFKLQDPEWFTSGGVQIRQRRVSGMAYNTDGTINVTAPCPVTGLALSVLGSTSIRVTWDATTDDCTLTDGGTLGGGSDTFEDGGLIS